MTGSTRLPRRLAPRNDGGRRMQAVLWNDGFRRLNPSYACLGSRGISGMCLEWQRYFLDDNLVETPPD